MSLKPNTNIDWQQVLNQGRSYMAPLIALITCFGFGFSYYHETQKELLSLHTQIEDLTHEHAESMRELRAVQAEKITVIEGHHDKEVRERDGENARLQSRLDIANNDRDWLRRELDRCCQVKKGI